MLTPYEWVGWGGLSAVLNITIFLLIMTVSDRWGCPSK